MSTFTPAAAHIHAVNLVSAALGSGMIKLLGPDIDEEMSANRAKKDAEYLNALINSVGKNLSLPKL